MNALERRCFFRFSRAVVNVKSKQVLIEERTRRKEMINDKIMKGERV
mgnify:CR=1 FL=1